MSGRRGATLTELLVALTLLAMSGSYAARVLLLATRDMEGAELGLRAALFLSELREAPPGGSESERSVGGGTLLGEGRGAGVRIRYEPPSGAHPPPGSSGGFLRARSWTLEGEEEL